MANKIGILFVYPFAPFMKVVHIPLGLVAVMDIVSKVPNTKIFFKGFKWEDISCNQIENEIQKTNAQIVALPIYSDGCEKIKRIIKDLNNVNPELVFVVGGPHIEIVGKKFLPDIERIFFPCGPYKKDLVETFLGAIEIVLGIKPKYPFEFDRRSVTGQEQICLSILEKLDNKEWKSFRPVLITSLGCNHKCSFCAESNKYEGLIFRSQSAIKAELEWMSSKLIFPYIMIADDNSLADEKHSLKMLNLVAGVKKHHLNLHFFMLSRPEDIITNKDTLKSLVDLELINIQIGIESGCQRMRKRYGKNFTNEIVKDALFFLKEIGIHLVSGSFILGGPYEDESSLDRTSKLIEDLIDIAPGIFEPSFAFLRPYPGINILKSFADGLKAIPGVSIGNTIEDRPFFETPSLSETKLIKARDDLNEIIRNKIINHSSSIEFVDWMKKYEYLRIFHLDSAWINTYMEAPNCQAALEASFVNGYNDIKDFPSEKGLTYRPICTVDLPLKATKKGISLPFGRDKIIKVIPEQAQFLTFCNGNRNFREVVKDLNKYNSKTKSINLTDWWKLSKKLSEGLLLIWMKP